MQEYQLPVGEHHRLILFSDVHLCHLDWYQTSCAQRMDLFVQALEREYRENPFDGLLGLGDYSLDFWEWGIKGSYLGTPSVSNTKKFVEEVVPRLPLHPFLIPGNHEQYGNAKWQALTGFPRQFSIVYGDTVFLMLDTFAGNLDPSFHSDGTYTGIDTVFLKEALQKYQGKRIILCAHDVIAEKESPEAMALIRENPNILCAFTGHTHMSNSLLLGPEWGKLPVFYCGDFSYEQYVPEDVSPNWGFRRVDLKDGFATHYVPALRRIGESWHKDRL